MQKVLPDAGGITIKPQLAELALKLVIVFPFSTMVTCPHSGPFSLIPLYMLYQWGDRGVLGGTWVLVEVVGGGSNSNSHFTPFVRANSSYNFIRQTVEQPNPGVHVCNVPVC